MEEWRTTKLGNICSIFGRIGFRGYTTDDLTLDPNEGAISLSPTNIISGELDLSKLTYIKWNKYNESPEIMLKKNDIVIVKTGSSIGRTTLIREVVHPMTLNPQLVVLKNITINPIYLSYVIKTPTFQGLLKSITVGSAIPTLSQKNLANLPVTIPNRDEQDRIARILNSIDSKILLNNRINHNLEQQAQALYKSWFVDFEPFKDGKFVDSELGLIPEGWKVVSLAELMDYSGGSQPPASEFIDEEREGYVRFVQIRDYNSEGHITYIPISKKNKLCDVKDIMIARYGASLGRICFGLTGAYNVALAKVYPKRDYYLEFLRCYLNSRVFYEGINNKGNRAVQAGFNQSDIKSFKLAFPLNNSLLIHFEHICSSYFEQRLSLSNQSKQLSVTRDLLLSSLMTGLLQV